jgi:hypothetical protein
LNVPRPVCDVGIADYIEKKARLIAQHDLESGILYEFVHPLHHRSSDLDQTPVVVEALFELTVVDGRVLAVQRIDVQVLASLPRACNLRA